MCRGRAKQTAPAVGRAEEPCQGQHLHPAKGAAGSPAGLETAPSPRGQQPLFLVLPVSVDISADSRLFEWSLSRGLLGLLAGESGAPGAVILLCQSRSILSALFLPCGQFPGQERTCCLPQHCLMSLPAPGGTLPWVFASPRNLTAIDSLRLAGAVADPWPEVHCTAPSMSRRGLGAIPMCCS